MKTLAKETSVQKGQNIINFCDGLPGFQGFKEFTLMALHEDNPFYFLQSVKKEEICFILINPFNIFPDYEFDLPDTDMRKLNVRDPKDLAVFSIVNASRGIKSATVNLLAPVVVNTANGMARQAVLNDSRYSVRHTLPQTKAYVGV